MLMAVDIVRGATQRRFEGIQLCAKLGADRTQIQPARVGIDDETAQRLGRTREGALGEIDMQTDLGGGPVGAQRCGRGLPASPARHAAEALQACMPNQMDDGLINTGMQTEIIGDHADTPARMLERIGHRALAWQSVAAAPLAGSKRHREESRHSRARSAARSAAERLGIDPERPNPATR